MEQIEDKWKTMVKASREAYEDFNDFSEENAILWAADEIENYKKAIRSLVKSDQKGKSSLTVEEDSIMYKMIFKALSNCNS